TVCVILSSCLCGRLCTACAEVVLTRGHGDRRGCLGQFDDVRTGLCDLPAVSRGGGCLALLAAAAEEQEQDDQHQQRAEGQRRQVQVVRQLLLLRRLVHRRLGRE